VLRAGYGLYYNVMNTQAELAEIQNFRQLNATIANPSYPDPYRGLDPFTFVATTPQNIAVEANDLENLQSAAYTGGISRQLGAALAIHVDGVYNKMTKVPMAIDINPRSGGTTGNRLLPQFGRVLQTQSIGWANYKALLLRLEKRLEHNYMYTVSYTLASTEGNVSSSSFLSTVTDAAHIEYDQGPEQQRPSPCAGRKRFRAAAVRGDGGCRVHRAVDHAVQRHRGVWISMATRTSPITCRERRAMCSTVAATKP
jgi:hypothetical protein